MKLVKKLICVSLMFIMVFALNACADKEIIEEETENMVMLPLPQWSMIYASINYIKLKHSENAVFECSVEKNVLCTGEDSPDGKNATLKYNHDTDSDNGVSIAWWFGDYSIEQTFLDIILKVDGRIAGYAVIGIYKTEIQYSEIYEPRLLKSALFPKVEGKYQKINKTQVKVIIKKVKKQRG